MSNILGNIIRVALDEAVFFPGVFETDSVPRYVDEENAFGYIELDDGRLLRVSATYVEGD